MRFHGAKFLLAPWIISQFPLHRVYAEPYGGAAGVLLRKPRSFAEVYNDLDSEIVNVFRVLRDPARAARLKKLLTLTPYSRDEFDLSYRRTRNSVEQARRTIFRSQAAFSSDGATRPCRSGFRTNRHDANASEAVTWANLAQYVDLFVERLRGVIIENRPALELFPRHDRPDTLWYVDPPYVRSVRTAMRDGKRAYRHEMSDQDHRDLAGALHELKGLVILSGYNCPLYEELYADWVRIDRVTNADGCGGARRRVESIWLSPNVPPRQAQLEYERSE